MRYKTFTSPDIFTAIPCRLSQRRPSRCRANAPAEQDFQRLSIAPNPESRDERADFFGNPVTWFSIQEPHTSLEIIARSEVHVRPFQPPTALWPPAWEQVASMLKQRRDPDLLDARQYTFESTYVTVNAGSCGTMHCRVSKPADPARSVTELTNRIYQEFKFDSGVTTIGTPVLEVLQHRHGVCQDFAHLQIGCLRSLGMAARYVSGYLVTKPPPGRADWSARIPRTHGFPVSSRISAGSISTRPMAYPLGRACHRRMGRDYDDVSPVRGVVVGGHRHTLAVSVDVEPICLPLRRQDQGAIDRNWFAATRSEIRFSVSLSQLLPICANRSLRVAANQISGFKQCILLKSHAGVCVWANRSRFPSRHNLFCRMRGKVDDMSV